MKNKYKDLAVNTAIFSISSFASKILTFLLVPLYTSVLSKKEYGTADLISTTASLLIFVLTIDISDAVLRFAIDRKNDQEEILKIGLKIQLYGSTILGIALYIINKLEIIKWENYCYVFLFIIFSITAFHNTFSSYLRAINKLKAVAISGIIHTAAMIISNIVCLLFLHLGIIGYLISIVIGYSLSILFCVLNSNIVVSEIIKGRINKKTQKEMIAYSFPLIFNGVAWWMNSSLDKYFIISMINVGASGLYAVSSKIPSILTMFNSIFAQAWNLSAIKEFDGKDKDGFFAKTYSVYNAVMVIGCSVIIIFNVFLAKILYAKDFFEAWNYTSLLLISIVFSALSSFVGSIFSAVKNSKVYAISTVSAAIVNTLLNAILIPVFGIQGAAIATAISFFTIWLIRMICVRKYIDWKINYKRDALAYLLISIQATIEHYNNHNYIFQIIILIILSFLYLKEINMIIDKVKNTLIKRGK